MKELSKVIICEYKYDSEEEREEHVKCMESEGFQCDGQLRKSDDLITKEDRSYYWYGKFFKQLL